MLLLSQNVRLLLVFVLAATCVGQEEEENGLYLWNGTDRVLVPEKSELTPQIFYNFKKQGVLDGYRFLPGELSPLSSAQIKAGLDKIMSEDAYQNAFYTISDFPDKKFPVNPSEIPNPLTCLCTDVPPQTYLNENPALGPIEKLAGLEIFPDSCLEAVDLGLCANDTFIQETMPVYVPEGFCERSCGRCDCCETLLTLAQEYPELSLFLEVLEVTGLTSLLSSPATEATVLAPNDDAMLQALQILGIAIEDVQNYAETLQEILLFHVLPPHPFYQALWTTPFFVEGVTSDTLLSQQDSSTPPLSFRSTDENETFIDGPSNFALVEEKDIEACKGFLNIIDTVLLPYEIDSNGQLNLEILENGVIPSPVEKLTPSPAPVVESTPTPTPTRTPASAMIKISPLSESTPVETPASTIGSIFSSFIGQFN